MDSKDILELNQLILSAIDGNIATADFARLDRWIRDDSEAANHYVEFMILYAGLRQPGQVSTFFSETGAESESDSGLDMQVWNELASFEKTAETVETESQAKISSSSHETSPRVERKISRMAIYTSILSTAALLFMAVFVYLNPRTSNSVVGVLAETIDAQWRDNAAPMGVGQDLRAGVLSLQRGLAHVRFDSGASVILEGPAQVELLSGNSMSLRQGKIVATVGRDAIGFVVNTPQGKILDLGTEFGIQVDPVGQSQVHVFQGEVILYPTNQDGRMKVSEGDAKSVDQSGKVVDIPLQTAAFVRQDEMSSKLLAQTGNSYYRWKAWVFDIHRDPSLVAHYFYAKDNTRPESLLNAVAAAKGPAGHFGGQGRTAPTWVTGRWPEKSAVRFERGKNQAIIIGADPTLSVNGPVTVSTWVYYPNKTQMGGHLISCRQDYHVNFQFSMFDEHYKYEYQRNQFEFLRFNQKDSGCYSQEFIQKPQTWYHFVMTYDMGTVCFYVNGKLFESKPYISRSDAKETEIIIGALKWDNRYVLPEGDFDGIIDDLMIFNRSLGGDEIQKIYEAGLPASGSAL
jgi:hypothetical protein